MKKEHIADIDQRKRKLCPICFKCLSDGGYYHHLQKIHGTSMKKIKEINKIMLENFTVTLKSFLK
jgi:hypothetical protein